MFNQLWGLYNRGEVRGQADADVDATDAWDIEVGSDVIVGVCDGGVDYEHEDLAANIYKNPNEIPGNNIDDDNNGFIDDVRGWDFGDDDNDPMDESGHGTHVAGTIAAVGNNGIGITGVNWHARIMPLKIVDINGEGFTYPAARAIEYAVMMGARVTNHSWGGGNPSSALNDAIIAAQEAGVLTVASAGNAGRELNDYHQHFPAGLPFDGIVSVANTNRNDQLAGSSNWSSENVDLGAPGSGILSTTPGNRYESFTGTSMSAPHVTGAISLIWAHAPRMSAMQVKELLLANVDPLPDLDGRTVSGGRLNLHSALAALDSRAPETVSDLTATPTGPTAVSLTWTASGDDGASGTAKRNDIRFSLQPIDASNFSSARRLFDLLPPKPAGSTESHTLTGLDYGTTYYFAMRVYDAHGNASPLSNIAVVTTLIADPPPQVAVSPSNLVKTLMTGGLATKSFSISNNGPGDLFWTIDVIEGEYVPGVVTHNGESLVLSRQFDIGQTQMAPPVGVIEGFLNGVHIVFDVSYGRTQDRWDGVVDDLVARGAQVALVADPFSPTLLDTTDVLWLTDPHPPAEITAEQVALIGQFVKAGGGLLLDGDDDVSVGIFNRILDTLGAGIEYSSADGVPGTSSAVFPHETTAGVTSVAFNQNGSHLTRVSPPAEVLVEDPNTTAAAAAAAIGSGRVVAMADELFDDARYETEDNRRFANRVFGWLAGTYWVSPAPIAGALRPGESSEIEVEFDARGLAGGIYEADLKVETNDPLSPSTPVTATLGVTAAPDIDISHTAVEYGLVFTTVTDTETLAVHNGGKDQLMVYDLGVTGGDFSVDVSNFALEPDEGREIAVTVSPGAPGEITGTLTVISNDPDDAIIEIPLSAT
ncbi:MAG: S8 family serine peptidase, partial [Candidatus Latescibacterota bacterium]